MKIVTVTPKCQSFYQVRSKCLEEGLHLSEGSSMWRVLNEGTLSMMKVAIDEDGSYIGVATVGLISTNPNKKPICMVYVKPKSRRLGVGTALLSDIDNVRFKSHDEQSASFFNSLNK